MPGGTAHPEAVAAAEGAAGLLERLFAELDQPMAFRCIGVVERPGLEQELIDGKVPVVQATTLDRAVALAHAAATPGETVLLSPACASFDQFSDYAARGAAFRDAVGAL